MRKYLPLLFIVLLAGCQDEHDIACAQQNPVDARAYQACMNVCFKLEHTDDFRRCEQDKQQSRDEADAGAMAAMSAATAAATVSQ